MLAQLCRADRLGILRALEEVEESAREKAATAVKRRMLGNVRLIGLLFVKGVLNHKIIHVCLNMMLSQEKEDYIEAVCEMLSLNSSNRSLGRLLEEVGGGKAGAKSAGKELMKGYFSKLQQLMKTGDMPSRVRFILGGPAPHRRGGPQAYIPLKNNYCINNSKNH